MASSLLPSKLWELDDLLEAYPKLYIKDLLEIPETESQSDIFLYRDHPVSTVDILGVIVKVDERQKIITYAVDDGTGVIGCSLFKNTSEVEHDDSKRLKDKLSNGPLQSKLKELLDSKREQEGFKKFAIGQLLHVQGTLQVYQNVRSVNVVQCVVVDCPTAEVERMLCMPKLYKRIYDKPFALLNLFAREASSIADSGLTLEELSIDLQAQDRLEKLLLAEIDDRVLESFCEQDLFDSIKQVSAEAIQRAVWKKALSSLEMTGHLCRHPTNNGDYTVILYNRLLHRTVTDIIARNMQNQNVAGCHIMLINNQLRNMLPYSQINYAAVSRCLVTLEELSEIICISNKCFAVLS